MQKQAKMNLFFLIAIGFLLGGWYSLKFGAFSKKSLSKSDVTEWFEKCKADTVKVGVEYLVSGKVIQVVTEKTHPQYNKKHPLIRHEEKNEAGETVITYEFREPKLSEGDKRRDIWVRKSPCNFELYLTTLK